MTMTKKQQRALDTYNAMDADERLAWLSLKVATDAGAKTRQITLLRNKYAQIRQRRAELFVTAAGI